VEETDIMVAARKPAVVQESVEDAVMLELTNIEL
tara:strand:- start:6 stop:107 length:102 start_codon:yes stop_codon:yes gene_type:complete